ncbi:MAG: hypothetical protein GX810_01710, partial [Clostridiales bacterium]|nr:hypothetical protein [Clostridiales bacterium]
MQRLPDTEFEIMDLIWNSAPPVTTGTVTCTQSSTYSPDCLWNTSLWMISSATTGTPAKYTICGYS